MFGIINLSKNQGSLKIYNYYSFENFLFDMTDMVIKNFRNVSFKYQRKLIFNMGKELYDYLVDFNGKIRPISEEMSEDIYNNLIDIDLIEEYICYFKNL